MKKNKIQIFYVFGKIEFCRLFKYISQKTIDIIKYNKYITFSFLQK